jgi:hypothetical protein
MNGRSNCGFRDIAVYEQLIFRCVCDTVHISNVFVTLYKLQMCLWHCTHYRCVCDTVRITDVFVTLYTLQMSMLVVEVHNSAKLVCSILTLVFSCSVLSLLLDNLLVFHVISVSLSGIYHYCSSVTRQALLITLHYRYSKCRVHTQNENCTFIWLYVFCKG